MGFGGNYYKFREVTPNIRECLIEIPRFISHNFQEIDPDTYYRKKSIVFSLHESLQQFFTYDEIDRVNNFKVLKKQLEWMAGKVAVKKLVAARYNCDGASVIISAEQNGAPFLPDYQSDFISISHSGDYAVACLGTGCRAALDIEKIEAGRMKTISRVAFSEKELDKNRDASETDLYINWTIKEAYLKYIKKGFAEGLKKVEIIDGTVVHNNVTMDDIVVTSEIIEREYAFSRIYSR